MEGVKRIARTAGPMRELALLEALAAADPAEGGLSIGACVALTAIPRATCHRLMHSLVSQGYVERLARGRYVPGWRVHLLCHTLSARSMVTLARPVLEELVAATGQTAHLGVLHGSSAVYIACVDSPSSLRLAARPGSRISIHVSAIGMVLAACLPEREREALVRGTAWEQRTRFSLTDPDALLAALDTARERGYAVDEGGYAADVRCMAVAVVEPGNRRSVAVGISGLASDLRTDDPAAIAAVRRAAEGLSAALAAQGSLPAGQRATAETGDLSPGTPRHTGKEVAAHVARASASAGPEVPPGRLGGHAPVTGTGSDLTAPGT